jgi:hypothetical protein
MEELLIRIQIQNIAVETNVSHYDELRQLCATYIYIFTQYSP